jgi:hypothetical protein
MWLTFKEAKDSALSDIASTCSDSNLFRSYVNQAAEQLLIRGQWKDTVQKIRICSYTGCIVWPRWVEVPLAFRACNNNLPVKGVWWEFMPVDGGSLRDCMNSFGPAQGPFIGNVSGMAPMGAENEAFTPVQRDIVGQSKYIRAYISRQADIGKTFTIFGIDDNGQVIRTVHPDGFYRDGVVITCALPFAGPNFKIREIVRVLKDTMDGESWLYQYDADQDALIDCAHYEPTETNPQYLRTITNSGIWVNRREDSEGNRCAIPFTALVKIRFIPVVGDNDVIIVNNLAALKWQIMSIKKGDAGDVDGKRQFEMEAVREMNAQLRNAVPLDQIPVSVNPFRKAVPYSRWNQRQVF